MPMMARQEEPCKQCREGRHRVCEHPRPMITLLSYRKIVKRERTSPESVPETLTCCDEREFWVEKVFP